MNSTCRTSGTPCEPNRLGATGATGPAGPSSAILFQFSGAANLPVDGDAVSYFADRGFITGGVGQIIDAIGYPVSVDATATQFSAAFDPDVLPVGGTYTLRLMTVDDGGVVTAVPGSDLVWLDTDTTNVKTVTLATPFVLTAGTMLGLEGEQGGTAPDSGTTRAVSATVVGHL